MKLTDWMISSSDFMSPGALATPSHHHGIGMTRTRPKVHMRPQGLGHEGIRGDASPSDFNRTHLWEEPSATDTEQRKWLSKRDVEKSHRRNMELFEVNSSAETTGPCGCTLKLGEEAVVEGGFRGIITHRNNRVLTVAMGDGVKMQVDQKFVHRIKAYGTSEGVKKGWDTRGRGKALLEKHGFTQKGDRWLKRTSGGAKGENHVFQVRQDGSWYHGYHGGYATKPFGTGSGFQSAKQHLETFGAGKPKKYFGDLGKQGPGYEKSSRQMREDWLKSE